MVCVCVCACVHGGGGRSSAVPGVRYLIFSRTNWIVLRTLQKQNRRRTVLQVACEYGRNALVLKELSKPKTDVFALDVRAAG